MIAPAAMEEGTGRDRRSKARAEKDMHRRAARSSFIKELANEVEGRPEEVKCVFETFGLVTMIILWPRYRCLGIDLYSILAYDLLILQADSSLCLNRYVRHWVLKARKCSGILHVLINVQNKKKSCFLVCH
jgi:hypothetical protein